MGFRNRPNDISVGIAGNRPAATEQSGWVKSANSGLGVAEVRGGGSQDTVGQLGDLGGSGRQLLLNVFDGTAARLCCSTASRGEALFGEGKTIAACSRGAFGELG